MDYDCLIITPFFRPNVGGVETHLDDLVTELDKKNYKTKLLTLMPVTTKNTNCDKNEVIGSVDIVRFNWKSSYIYHWSENFPIINMLYIFPYFFFKCLFYILKNKISAKNVHCQGINAGLIGLILNLKIKSNILISTHALYNTDNKFFFKKFLKFFFPKFDCILCVSNASKQQILEINPNIKNKVFVYVYWVNTNLFRDLNLIQENKITFTFIGRLIEKKGVRLLVNAAVKFPNINFKIAGSGPEENYILEHTKKFSNLIYLGNLPNKNLTKAYCESNFICLPSLYPEGLARVMLESLACGTPLIATKLGSIVEALDDSVAIFTDPNEDSFFNKISKCSLISIDDYKQMRLNCRQKALDKFSEKNFDIIANHYL